MKRPSIEELKALAESAEEGPWEAVASEDRHHMSWVRQPHMPDGANSIALVGASDVDQEQANVEFIAASRTAIPALADYALSLEANFTFEPDEALRVFNGCVIIPQAKFDERERREIARRDALREAEAAIDQALDDMGEYDEPKTDGLSVCPACKDMLRSALASIAKLKE